MFIPLYDDNPLRRIATPIVTRALIVVSASVFVLFESGFVFDAQMASVGLFGVIPAEFHLGGGLRSERSSSSTCSWRSTKRPPIGRTSAGWQRALSSSRSCAARTCRCSIAGLLHEGRRLQKGAAH